MFFQGRYKSKGMTLVELIIVISIIAILIAIAVPGFGGIVKNAKEQAVLTTANEIMDAMHNYSILNDEEIRHNGGFNVQVEATSNGLSYDWKIYTNSREPQAMCSLGVLGYIKVLDSKEGVAKVEPFENYIMSLIDPETGNHFKTIFISYGYEEGYNGEHIVVMLMGEGYTLLMDNYGEVQSW